MYRENKTNVVTIFASVIVGLVIFYAGFNTGGTLYPAPDPTRKTISEQLADGCYKQLDVVQQKYLSVATSTNACAKTYEDLRAKYNTLIDKANLLQSELATSSKRLDIVVSHLALYQLNGTPCFDRISDNQFKVHDAGFEYADAQWTCLIK